MLQPIRGPPNAFYADRICRHYVTMNHSSGEETSVQVGGGGFRG